MAYEQEVLEIMENIVIADKHPIANIMAHRKIWTPGASSYTNTGKVMDRLTEERKLVKEDKYYRLPSCESKYKNHAKLLTSTLSEMYCLDCRLTIHRERLIKDKGLRPDSIVLLTRGNEGRCVILEQLDNEEEDYLRSKVRVWENWNEATEYLTDLFKVKIPHFEIVAAGMNFDVEGVSHFNYWKEAL